MALLGKIKAFIVHVPNCNVLLFLFQTCTVHCTLVRCTLFAFYWIQKPSFLFKVGCQRDDNCIYSHWQIFAQRYTQCLNVSAKPTNPVKPSQATKPSNHQTLAFTECATFNVMPKLQQQYVLNGSVILLPLLLQRFVTFSKIFFILKLKY